MNRIIIVTITCLATCLGIGYAGMAAASASTNVCTLNGNGNCIGDNGLNVGDHVIQVNPVDARKMTYFAIDNNCSKLPGTDVCTRYYVKFYNGDYLAMNNACTGGPIVKDPSATTGIVWDDSLNGSPTWSKLANQHCNDGEMGADDIVGHRWELDSIEVPGILYKLNVDA